MDEQNVHQFWGVSPGIDLSATSQVDSSCVDPIKILQVSPSDCRHTLHTLTGFSKRNTTSNLGHLHIFIYEDNPEALARHLTLLCTVLDQSLSPDERAQTFLEVLGNALVQSRTARYLARLGRRLEDVVLNCTNTSLAQPKLVYLAPQLFDFSLLSFQDRDRLAEVLRSYSSETLFDMESAWDIRCRKYYQTHYDHRENQMDWDYWMKLCAIHYENPDDSMRQSIIHKKEFITWRSSGIAFQQAMPDESIRQPNRSLISNVEARTKEFKTRLGKDIGRKVVVRGYWGDIVNSPYHTFGTTSDEKTLFEKSNKEFKHTAGEVALFNVKKLIEDLDPTFKYNKDTDSQSLKQERSKVPRIVFLTGDFHKKITNNKKLQRQIDVVYLAWHQMQKLVDSPSFDKITKDHSLLVCEDLRGLLSLQKKQVEELRHTINTKAKEQGWNHPRKLLLARDEVSQYYLFYTKGKKISK